MPSSSSRRRRRGQRGQAMVELVLVLPIMLVILFGIIDFGFALNYWNDLNQVSGETARRAAVNQTNGWTPGDYACGRAESSLRHSSRELKVTVTMPPADGHPAGTVGAPVEIKSEARYPLVRLLPGTPGLLRINLSGTASMRLEAPAKFGAGTKVC